LNVQQFQRVLKQVLDELLEDMMDSTNHPNDPFVRQSIPNIKTVLQELPAWPTTWDVNNGLCIEFADRVVREVPEAIVRHDEGPAAMGHWFVEFQGRFYDAESLEGVGYYWQLPIYTVNRAKCRADVLEDRGVL